MKKKLIIGITLFLLLTAIAYALVTLTYVGDWNIDTTKNGLRRIDEPTKLFVNGTVDTSAQFDFSMFTDLYTYRKSSLGGHTSDSVSYIIKLQQSADGANWMQTESLIVAASDTAYTRKDWTPVRSLVARFIRYERMGTNDSGTVTMQHLLIQ